MRDKDLKTKHHPFVYACLHGTPTPTGAYVHPVGAYGVVGFSGVKDARKSVSIADASAAAGFWRAFQAEECKRKAERQHLESIWIADRKHSVSRKRTAHGV